MTDSGDEPLDLDPIRDDATARAQRIATGVARKMALARAGGERQARLAHDVRRQLARWALPAWLLAAAASIALLVWSPSRAQRRSREAFAVVVLGRGPATGWIALDRRPEIGEVVAVMRSVP